MPRNAAQAVLETVDAKPWSVHADVKRRVGIIAHLKSEYLVGSDMPPPMRTETTRP